MCRTAVCCFTLCQCTYALSQPRGGVVNREQGRIAAFTSSEVLLDEELARLAGEADRKEGSRRADVYLIDSNTEFSLNAYESLVGPLARKTFFKHAFGHGVVVGASVKSDLGLRDKRTSSGELHLDYCPVTFFAIPRINEYAGTLSDIAVCAATHFPVSAGRICYLGSGKRTLKSIEGLRCVHD